MTGMQWVFDRIEPIEFGTIVLLKRRQGHQWRWIAEHLSVTRPTVWVWAVSARLRHALGVPPRYWPEEVS